jgi:hypothetical protein
MSEGNTNMEKQLLNKGDITQLSVRLPYFVQKKDRMIFRVTQGVLQNINKTYKISKIVFWCGVRDKREETSLFPPWMS